MRARILTGDCREVLAELPPNSIDACVTDPPYGLEFMGKEWDKLTTDLPNAAAWKGRRATKRITKRTDDGVCETPWAKESSGYRGNARQGFQRCTKCGKRTFSGSPCRCPEPELVWEYPEGAPTGAIVMQRWHETWAREVFRVLKPGAHLLAFSGTRTSHRMVCAIEDAGFEIRDCLMWLYGSGFPKSLDVSKALDKAAGVEREVVGKTTHPDGNPRNLVRRETGVHEGGQRLNGIGLDITAPATDLAKEYAGYGTALKPAYEPIVLARKPLIGSVAANVTAYGTGGINVDGCRIGTDDALVRPEIQRFDNTAYGKGLGAGTQQEPSGRWPANVILDDEAAALLDVMSGERQSSQVLDDRKTYSNGDNGWSGGWAMQKSSGYGDTGGASRFFYTSKSSRRERNKGLAGMPDVSVSRIRQADWTNRCEQCGSSRPHAETVCGKCGGATTTESRSAPISSNHHPTVKPVDLMQWLVRLITPKGGTVLDPFLGSGTTGIAADREGFDFIGIEQDPEYAEIARKRIVGDCPLFTTIEGDQEL